MSEKTWEEFEALNLTEAQVAALLAEDPDFPALLRSVEPPLSEEQIERILAVMDRKAGPLAADDPAKRTKTRS